MVDHMHWYTIHLWCVYVPRRDCKDCRPGPLFTQRDTHTSALLQKWHLYNLPTRARGRFNRVKHECSRAWNRGRFDGGFCHNSIVPVFSVVWACGATEGAAWARRGIRQSRQHRDRAYEFKTSRWSNARFYPHRYWWRRNYYWRAKACKFRWSGFKLATTCGKSYQGARSCAPSNWTFLDEKTAAVRVLATTAGIRKISKTGIYNLIRCSTC